MPSKTPLPQPAMRRLKVYAFDPNASLDLGSAKFNQATISLAWDPSSEESLRPGPINDYFEVIDIDPVSNKLYPPVDLEHPDLLAQDGLPPTEGDPRFHQQMVFAVAMKTVRLFERALGRKVLWAPVWSEEKQTYEPTWRLRIYPHALREKNAYYSRKQRALLFGYFKATQRSTGANWVFTALSHDIIVHETTHAILDGLHPRLIEPTNDDSLAFHEAFADIAALFSHFMLKEAVSHHVAQNGGRLDQSSLMSGLASQFAKGTSGRASLRDYLASPADPDVLENTIEAHDRGAILVAAVFDAFLTIYRARTGDLLRLANIIPGSSPHLHPDLVERLTDEAMKTADHVLRMCIRALDYLPPIDVRFGDFLRSIVTADSDLIPDDKLNYRLAFIEAFRRRGIFPEGTLSLSPDNLLWPRADRQTVADEPMLNVADVQNQVLDVIPLFKRRDIFKQGELNRKKLWYWLAEPELRMKATSDVEERRAEARQRLNLATDALQAAMRSTDAKASDLAKREFDSAFRQFRRLETVRNPDTQNREKFARILNSIRAAVVNRDIDSLKEAQSFVQYRRNDLLWLGFSQNRRGVDELAVLAGLLAKACHKDGKFPQWKALFAHIEKADRVERDYATDRLWEKKLGIYFNVDGDNHNAKKLFSIRHRDGLGTIQIATVRATRRSGPDGENIRQMVVHVTQKRYGFFDPAVQDRCDNGDLVVLGKTEQDLTPEQLELRAKGDLRLESEVDFNFRGGATLIIDLGDNCLRYVISKTIDSDERLEEQRRVYQRAVSTSFTYDRSSRNMEPFALLHRH